MIMDYLDEHSSTTQKSLKFQGKRHFGPTLSSPAARQKGLRLGDCAGQPRIGYPGRHHHTRQLRGLVKTPGLSSVRGVINTDNAHIGQYDDKPPNGRAPRYTISDSVNLQITHHFRRSHRESKATDWLLIDQSSSVSRLSLKPAAATPHTRANAGLSERVRGEG